MKRSLYIQYIAAFVMAVTTSTAYSSDPQMFIYRNDSAFNSTHLRSGVNVTHSISDKPTMHINDEKGNMIDIPLAAIDSCVLRLVDIPTLYFTLPDSPDAKDIWSKEDYVDAILNIEGNGYCDDIDSLKLSLRGRGNTTWGMAKKPMRMKFPKKISLFGFAKQKNYVLLANYIDDSLMKNVVAFWIARRLGVPYANHTVPVNVVINGHPRGSYLITEKVGINSGSVDIDETKGILFELSVEYDEKYKFRSEPYDLPVMVKDPDFDELAEDNPEGPSPDEMLKMWEEDFNRVLRLLQAGRSEYMFDWESCARGLLMNNICLNGELGHPKSLYFHKESLGTQSLYKFGPAWDFDATFNMRKRNKEGEFVEMPPTAVLVLHPMLREIIKRQECMSLYKEALEKFASEDLPELLSFIKEYAATIDPSSKMDAVIWPEYIRQDWFDRKAASNVKESAELLCQWLTERIEFLLDRAEHGWY